MMVMKRWLIILTITILLPCYVDSGKQTKKKPNKPGKETTQANGGKKTTTMEENIRNDDLLIQHFLASYGNPSSSGTNKDESEEPGPSGEDHSQPGKTMRLLLGENETSEYVGKTVTVKVRPGDMKKYIKGVRNGITLETIGKWVRKIPTQYLTTPSFRVIMREFYIHDEGSLIHSGMSENELVVTERLIICATVTAMTILDHSETDGIGCLTVIPGTTIFLNVQFDGKTQIPVVKYDGSTLQPAGLFMDLNLHPIPVQGEDSMDVLEKLVPWVRWINDKAISEAVKEMNEKYGNRPGSIDVQITTEVLGTAWSPLDQDDLIANEELFGDQQNGGAVVKYAKRVKE